MIFYKGQTFRIENRKITVLSVKGNDLKVRVTYDKTETNFKDIKNVERPERTEICTYRVSDIKNKLTI